MSKVAFSVESIVGLEPAVEANYGTRSLDMVVHMTDEQMFHALQMFQAQITDETWARWMERIAEEAS